MERVPPVADMSELVKSLEDSERMKLRVAVSPAFNEEESEEMMMVGLMVSTVRVTVLFESEPSLLVLPAESENLDDATEIKPSVLLLFEGVKVDE